MLGRAMKDRLLAGGGTLFAAAAGFPMAGRREIELRSHEPAHPKRTAVVELRYGAVDLSPQDERDHSLPPTVRLRLVDVRNGSPEGYGTAAGRLLTTHTIADAAAAWEIVDGTASLGHRAAVPVMKSQGLQLEDSQIARRTGW